MQIDKTANDQAIKYAEKLNETGNFVHSQVKGLGENLYMEMSFEPFEFTAEDCAGIAKIIFIKIVKKTFKLINLINIKIMLKEQ
jgi:hypothetical protein